MPTNKVHNIIKVETCKREDQFVIKKTCSCMIVQEMPNSGCTLWPVYARKNSLTVYSPRPAFGGAADTLAVVNQICMINGVVPG